MKNNDYYLGNDECLPTVLDLKTTDNNIHIELPWDVSIEDLCHAFYTACIGITFHPETVIQGMKDFAEEHSNDISEEDE